MHKAQKPMLPWPTGPFPLKELYRGYTAHGKTIENFVRFRFKRTAFPPNDWIIRADLLYPSSPGSFGVISIVSTI